MILKQINIYQEKYHAIKRWYMGNIEVEIIEDSIKQ